MRKRKLAFRVEVGAGSDTIQVMVQVSFKDDRGTMKRLGIFMKSMRAEKV